MQNNENNTNWQSYVEKNYKSTGTKTNMQDVKLLGIENYKTSQNNIFLQQIDEAIKVTYSKREMLVLAKTHLKCSKK